MQLADVDKRLDVQKDGLVDDEDRANELVEAKKRILELESQMKEQKDASMKQLLEAETKLEAREDAIENLKQELDCYKDHAKSKDDVQKKLDSSLDRYSKSQMQLGITQKELAALQVGSTI